MIWLLLLAILLCALAIWIVLPPFHVGLLPLAVAAPELSPWLLAGALVLCGVTYRASGVDVTARVVFNLAAAAAIVCAPPLVRAVAALGSYDRAMEQALGRDYEMQMPAAFRAALRSSPV